MLDVKTIDRENGKPCFKLSKKTNCHTYNRRSKKTFHSGADNIFLLEFKVNPPRPDRKRRFVLSIRRDGIGDNQGEFNLSQINLDESELLVLKENIEKMLYLK